MSILQCFLFAALLTRTSAKKCYAIAVSGGGDMGSYEAGVIQGLVQRHAQEPEVVGWNAVTGISAGSNIATGMGLFDIGDEVNMADHLVKLVTDFTKKDIFKYWLNPLKYLDQSGLLNTAPYLQTLLKTIAPGKATKNPRKITIGATEDVSGNLVHFTEALWTKCAADDFKTTVCPDEDCTPATKLGDQCGGDKCPKGCKYTNASQWADYVRASSAVPAVFESVTLNGNVYSDGGVVTGVDLFAAVNRCREIVDKDEDIVVDMISVGVSPAQGTFNQETDNKVLPLYMRWQAISAYYKKMQSIKDACVTFPNVDWRYFVQPSKKLPSNGLQFDKEAMLEMVKIGNADAHAVQAGQMCKNLPTMEAQSENQATHKTQPLHI